MLVNNQAELDAAIAAQEPEIEVPAESWLHIDEDPGYFVQIRVPAGAGLRVFGEYEACTQGTAIRTFGE